VEDTIDSEAVKKEIAELEQSIGEYDRAIATLKG
jgi:prefoldin subunit 5